MSRRKKLPEEPFELEIASLLENGRGQATHGEKLLEVHGALPGERVLARYLFGRRFRGQAETLEVKQESGDRVEPRCPHFGTCSACSLQHLGHRAQLEFKQATMLSHLGKQGGVTPGLVLPPLSASRWNYRRKARLSVRYVKAKGRALVGFRERDGRFVTDMQECHVLDAAVVSHLGTLSELITTLDGREQIPQIEVSCGDDRCALIFRHLEPLSASDVQALEQFADHSEMAVYLQPKGPDSIRPLRNEEPGLGYALPEFQVHFDFEPLDFIQVNADLNRVMIGQALELLDAHSGDRVLDLFCGLGNFSLPLARVCHEVAGLEGDPGLVERARQNAARNGLENVHFTQADLYAEEPRVDFAAGGFNKVLLDPPRSGAEKVLPMIADSAATRVVYVSCNPETLGRDAGLLVDRHGFSLKSAGIMDMFPQTPHIEAMALFEREVEEAGA